MNLSPHAHGSPRTHRLNFPLSASDALRLRAGDSVLLDGEIVITAGLPTHQRLLRCLDGDEALPMPLHGASLFHLGGYSRETAGEAGSASEHRPGVAPDAGFELLYLNPTTSTRFNPYMPALINGFGWHAVGGKGGLDAQCVAAMQSAHCVYLSFLGGGCTLLTRAIREVLHVGWPDMLTHYRLVRLKVQDLGPAIVGIDAHGRSLYAEGQQAAQDRLPDILRGLAQRRAQS